MYNILFEKVVDAENQLGFTDYQRELLNQQLRQHVQLATQCFIQVYGHPEYDLWKKANTYKQYLVCFITFA